MNHTPHHNREGDDSKSDDEEEQGREWCPIFDQVIRDNTPHLLNLSLFGSDVPPCSAWGESDDDRTRSCLVLPLTSQTGGGKVVGVLVAGVNPRHELDENYRYTPRLLLLTSERTLCLASRFGSQCMTSTTTNRIFFNLFANSVSAIITNATACEEERKRAEACSARARETCDWT
jgi:hypothetical protein